jgi:hypothetical protein
MQHLPNIGSLQTIKKNVFSHCQGHTMIRYEVLISQHHLSKVWSLNRWSNKTAP